MDTLKCPVCGEVNPADLEFCQNCQSRLQPLTGPLKGENNPIQPGQIPTKKVTSELEPILPRWLREAREKARSSGEDTIQPKEESPAAPGLPKSDLLAGLASQGTQEEEEELPDWLAGITGGTPSKKKKVEPEETQVKWVELGGPDDFMGPPPDVSAGAPTEAPAVPTPEEKTGPSWMNQPESASEKNELADFLSRLQEQSTASAAEEPVVHFDLSESKPGPPPTSAPVQDADWLSTLKTRPLSTAKLGGEYQAPASAQEVPDWLKSLDSQKPSSAPPPPEPTPQPSASIPDWLQSGSVASGSGATPPPSDVPDWLKSLDQAAATPITTQPVPSRPAQEVPDWLKTTPPPPAEAEKGPPPPEGQPLTPETPAPETPDWLAFLKPVEVQSPQPPQPSVPTPASEEPPAQELPSVPAFSAESMAGADVDDIFASMQMPDWLSSVAPTPAVEPPAAVENPPSTPTSETPIAPAELPSWVQAMRPVESSLSASSAISGGTTLETTGPLEGLHDVLPAATASPPMSKPRALSIKLSATEEQKAQSVLLEQILAAETAPVPMKSDTIVLNQRLLRWALTALLFLVLGGSVIAGTQFFPLPNAVPNETVAAIQTMDQIPQASHVLVVFDYEPSTAGEMEAVAGPLLDHLLLLKHPQLVVLSTSPTGPALAEHLISSTLADRHYQRNSQYVDLGYLPGGLAGVNDFAQNPAQAMPLGADGAPVWQISQQYPPIQTVTGLSDFATMIVLTDSLEAGRVWIEQTTGWRGTTPLVMVSSAQAGPMLLPYFQSGQVSGLVSGMVGGAAVEKNNAGLPGNVRRYWDAYNLGLLMAFGLMVLGGFWNFVLGLRARRNAQDEA